VGWWLHIQEKNSFAFATGFRPLVCICVGRKFASNVCEGNICMGALSAANLHLRGLFVFLCGILTHANSIHSCSGTTTINVEEIWVQRRTCIMSYFVSKSIFFQKHLVLSFFIFLAYVKKNHLFCVDAN
jgi:hypothetical protein